MDIRKEMRRVKKFGYFEMQSIEIVCISDMLLLKLPRLGIVSLL